MAHAPNTTVEHQAGGCRLCSVSLEDIQVAYLLCADCQRLARAGPALLEALKLAQTESNCAAEMFAEHIRKGNEHEIMNALLAIHQATTAAVKAAKGDA